MKTPPNPRATLERNLARAKRKATGRNSRASTKTSGRQYAVSVEGRWHDPKPKPKTKPDAHLKRDERPPKVAPVVAGPQLDIEEQFQLPSYTQRAPAVPLPKSENERDRNTGNRSVVSFRLRTSTIEALDKLVDRMNEDTKTNSAATKTTKTWIVEELLRDHLKKEGLL